MSNHPDKPVPYVGPRPFKRDESEFFFGRRLEVNDLISLVTAYQIVLLYAQSGAGKTSLLEASLIPRLEEEEKFHVLPPARVRSQGQIKDAPDEIKNIFVFNALSNMVGEQLSPAELAQMSLSDFIQWHKLSLGDEEASSPWTLIFDQFEELFTHHLDRWEDRQDFFRQVSSALEADTRLRVIFAMREDYIAELDPYAQLLPGKLRTRFRMERLRRSNALEAIKEPLHAPSVQGEGRQFAKGVAEALVDDLLKIRVKSGNIEKEVIGQFVEPVQLQVVCQALWEELKPGDKLITFDHLKASGNVNEALTKFYERSIKEAATAGGISEGALRRWFDRTLITPEGNRSTVLRGSQETAGIPNAAIDVLEAKRLLRSEPRDGRMWYELGQDRFIKPIQESYKKWLTDQPGDEQTRLQLEKKAHEWVSSGRRDKSFLLDQGELHIAKLWMESEASTGAYSDALDALVRASEAEIITVERERERQLAEEQSLRAIAESERAAALEQRAKEQERRIEAERQRAQEQQRLLQLQGERAQEQQRLAEERAEARQREAERAIAQADKERQRAEDKAKDLRRMRALAAGLALMFLLTTGVAGYALTKRSQAQQNYEEAQQNARRAEQNYQEAQRRAEEARLASASAETERQKAEQESVRAQKSEEQAVAARREAEQRRVEAENASRLAEERRGAAEASAAEAQRQKDAAELARQQTEEANRKLQELTGSLSSENKVSKSRELAANAFMQLDNDPELGLLLAIEAAEKSETEAARDALRETLKQSHIRSVINAGGSQMLGATFGQDGSVITFGGDGAVRTWDITEARNPKSIRSGPETGLAPRAVVFSKDGESFITIGDDDAQIWKMKGDGRPVRLQGDKLRIISAAFNSDGRYVITAHEDGGARVWDASTGGALAILQTEIGSSSASSAQAGGDAKDSGRIRDDAKVTSVAFSPDDNYVVTTKRNVAQIWKAGAEVIRGWRSQESADPGYKVLEQYPLTTLSGHVGEVNSAAFSPDGKLLVTTSNDRTARLWSVDPKSDSFTVKYQLVEHEGEVTGAAFSPDSSFVATVGKDRTARVWDVNTGLRIAVLRGHTSPVNTIIFSADNNRVVTTSDDHSARVWEVTVGGKTRELSEHRNFLSNVVLSPDRRLFVTTSFDHTALVRDIMTGKVLKELRGHVGPVVSAAFSPDSKYIVTASDDKTARVWDAQTGDSLHTLRGHELEVNGATFSADGSLVLTSSFDGTVRLWEMSAGRSVALLRPADEDRKQNPVSSAALSPDGRLVAVAYYDENGEVYVWNAQTRRKVATLRGHTNVVSSVAFSRDGQKAVTASLDGIARIWDTTTWKQFRSFDNHGASLRGATLSYDSKYLLTWGGRTADIWGVSEGQKLSVLREHSEMITSAYFSPDSRLVVTSSKDGTVQAWDVISQESLIELKEQQPVVSVTFDPSRNLIITAGFDAAHIYDCLICGSTEGLKLLASERRSRNLKPEEQALYLKNELNGCATCNDLPTLKSLARERVTRPLTPSERKKFLE